MQRIDKTVLNLLAITYIIAGISSFGLVYLLDSNGWSWRSCSVNVIADESISIEKIKIEYGLSAMSINRKSDADLFGHNYRVLFDGGKTGNLRTDYGENDFLLTYDNTYYYQFRHFITNSHTFHNYTFHFTQLHDWPCVEVTIKGRNEMYFYRPLLKIADAKYHN